jgi:hypothetical protein
MAFVTQLLAVKLAAENIRAYISSTGMSTESVAKILGVPYSNFSNAISNATNKPGERGGAHKRSPHRKTTAMFCFHRFLPDEVRHAWIIVHFYEVLCAHEIFYTVGEFPRWYKTESIAA